MRYPRTPALRIALGYALVAGAYIVFSDTILARLGLDAARIAEISLYKGLGFVAVTSIALFGLLQFQRRRVLLDAERRDLERARLLSLFYDLPFLGMAITHAETGRWLHVNDRLCQMLGYERAELLELTWDDLTHPDDLKTDGILFDRVRRRELDGYTLDKRYVHKDGSVLYATVDVKPVRRDDGSVEMVVGTFQDITRRLADAVELRREAELRETLLQNIPVMIGFVDAEYRPVFVNRAWTDTLGWSADEVSGLEVLERHYPDPDTRAEALAFIEAATGEWRDFRTVCLDGRVLDATWANVRLSDGTVIAIGIDISERKKAEAELRATKQIVEASPVMLFRWSPEDGWPVLHASHNVAQLGLDADRLMDEVTPFEALVHPDDLARVREEVAAHLSRHHSSFTQEYRLCTPGGDRWVRDHTSVEYGEDGAPSRIEGTLTDETARHEATRRLVAAESRFRALVEQSLVGIYITDGRVVRYANPRASEIFGYRGEDLVGTTLHDLVATEDRERVDRQIAERLRGLRDSARYEFHGRRRDGQELSIGVHGVVAEIEGERLIIGVMQDITARVHAERQIEEYVARLEKAITGTVGAVSYMVELRDPYTAGHERRVGDLAAALGKLLGMDEGCQRGLRIAGAVHDVGKIVVPAEILSRPGRLTEPEFAIVQQHAEQGYQILKDVDFPWPVAEVVRQHHERLDGSGYPRKLADGDIMLEARIMAVADVVESMASHRPYRAARGIDEALAEIEDGAGSRYDPSVAAACLCLFREQGYSLPS